jgi:hypothetical protein
MTQGNSLKTVRTFNVLRQLFKAIIIKGPGGKRYPDKRVILLDIVGDLISLLPKVKSKQAVVQIRSFGV